MVHIECSPDIKDAYFFLNCSSPDTIDEVALIKTSAAQDFATDPAMPVISVQVHDFPMGMSQHPLRADASDHCGH